MDDIFCQKFKTQDVFEKRKQAKEDGIKDGMKFAPIHLPTSRIKAEICYKLSGR
jgi:hypothetical protein